MMLHLASTALVFCRALQFVLAGLGVVLVVGTLLGDMTVLALMVISVFALVLFVGVLIVEVLVVRPIQRPRPG